MEEPLTLQPSLVQHLRGLELDMQAETGPPEIGWVRRRQLAVLAALDIGRPAQAMGFALQALELAGELDDPAAQAGAHMSVALIYSDNYDVASADHHFALARTLALHHPDRTALARVVINHSHHLLHGRDHLAAYQELMAQSDLFVSLDDPQMVSVYHVNLVAACVRLQLTAEPPPDGAEGGHRSEYLEQAEQSVGVLRALEDSSMLISIRLDVLDSYAQVALLQGRPEQALTHAQARLLLARQADSPILLAGAYRQLGQVRSAQHDWPAAIHALGEALRISEDGQQSVSVLELREALAAAHASAGDFRAAYLVQRGSGEAGLLMEQVLRQRAQIGAVERQALEADLRASIYREASERDFLTGVANRAQAMQTLDTLQQRLSAGVSASVAIALFDLDHFKEINDRYGHEVGDLVLMAVAQQVQGATRDQDGLSRYGGEEFLLILPDTSLPEAAEICDRLRLGLSQLRFPAWPDLRVTASFGVGVLQPGLGVQGALRVADDHLYRSKHAGRNRVSSGAAPADSSGPVTATQPEGVPPDPASPDDPA